MAVQFMPFDLKDGVFDDGDLELNGVESIASAMVKGVTYIYAAADEDDGIQIFTMDGEGRLTPFGVLVDEETGLELDGASGLTTTKIGNKNFLLVASDDDDGVNVFRILNDGTLKSTDMVDDGDDASLELNGANVIKTTTFDNQTWALVASFNDDGITALRMTGSGVLFDPVVADDGDAANPELNEVRDVEAIVMGERTFLYASGAADDGVTAYEMAFDDIEVTPGVFERDYTLTHLQNVSDNQSLALNGAASLASTTIGDTTYLLVGGRQDDGISVFAVDEDGLIDVGSAFTLFDGDLDDVFDLEVFEFQGFKFVVASMFGGNRVMVYHIEDNGSLVNVGLGDGKFVQGLTSAIRSHVLDVGDDTFMLISSRSGDAVFSYELGGLDDIVTGSFGADVMFGLDDDDDMVGRSGDDQMFGGDGEDLISGNRGNDMLYGGRDADYLFGRKHDDFLQGGKGGDILHGGGGVDTADYSLSSRVNINLEERTASGGQAKNDILIDIENLIGGVKSDTLIGDMENNTLHGGEGNDTLGGRDGADVLYGEVGQDTLNGNGGNDELYGGAWADLLNGGGGNDLLEGGGGDDKLSGRDGDDTLTGNGGEDMFMFRENEGSDRITDFNNNVDKIDMTGFSGVSQFSDITVNQIDMDVALSVGDIRFAVLVGVDESIVDATDFVF